MKRPQDEWNEEEIDIDDYPIGLPNGMPKPPMEYHLGLINKYLRENNKSVHELTREELEMFRPCKANTIMIIGK